MNFYDTHRMIKSEDLNHHGTLFAGRMSQWFVESCFVAAANEYKQPKNLVFLNMKELNFKHPIKLGDIINIKSKICYVGTKSICVYGEVSSLNNEDKILVDGFMTFVCVDDNGVSMAHNMILPEPITEKDLAIYNKAKSFKK
ncbi:acyl-CoA thioesterase [Romboutsia sp.]|uniref:acyl-CoA thioesterase n=1 Tax=Romboutsia sp. TaxID=1965302 RepID=UPI003F4070C2